MAVVKVFDANGVKTVELMGNVSEQEYDAIEEEVIVEEDVQASDDSVDF